MDADGFYMRSTGRWIVPNGVVWNGYAEKDGEMQYILTMVDQDTAENWMQGHDKKPMIRR